MRIKRNIILLLTICLLTVIVGAQETNMNKSIAVYANATVYANPAFDSVAVIDFPIKLNRNDFTFIKGDSLHPGYYASIFVFVKLLNINGIAIDSTQVIFPVKAISPEDALKKDMQLFQNLSLIVKPGIYSAQVLVIDVVSKKKGTFYIEKITVEQSSKSNSINISTLNSLDKAEYVADDSTKINPYIYKNGYNLYVNPVSVFADSDKSFYIYGEIYNLVYSEDSRTKYQLIINALDKNKNIYQMFGSRLSKKPGSSAVFVENIDIAGWERGNYTIEIIVVDLASQIADTALLPISIISTEEVILAANKIAAKEDVYSSLTLKQKMELVTYLFSDTELKTLSNLGEKGKENFMNAIWTEHDPTKNTYQNEFRDEIIRRYTYVNTYFSTNEHNTNGWNTARGRIYMQRGPWEDRDDKEAPTGNPFDVWYYHSIEGGLIYIFEDKYGDDSYQLVHSNANGEVFSKVWDEWITSGIFDTYMLR